MSSIRKMVLWLIVPAMLLLAAGVPYYLHYESHREKKLADLGKYQQSIEALRKNISKHEDNDARLAAYAQRTLGYDRETVDHRLREGLFALASDAGLITDDIIANAKAIRAIKNPAVSARVREFRRYASADFIVQPDYVVLDGEVSGTGSFDAVVRLLSLVQSQPWIWSVQSFNLKPHDSQGNMFDVRVLVSTIFMPDLAQTKPNDDATGDEPPRAPPIVDPGQAVVAATSAIVERNMFAPPKPKPIEPKPVVVTQAPEKPTPAKPKPAPPPPPWHEWRLTAISESPVQGTIAWLLNSRTNTAKLLKPGQAVLGARLIEVKDDQAVFEIGDKRYRLGLNETLADRHELAVGSAEGGTGG